MAAQNEASICVSSAPIAVRTHRGAGAIRYTNCALQIFRPVLQPLLASQELRRCNPRGTKLQPSVPAKKAPPESSRLPETLVLRPRSTRRLQRYRRKCCAPNRGEPLLEEAKAQNDGLTVQLNPPRSVPPLHDYPRSRRKPLHAIM